MTIRRLDDHGHAALGIDALPEFLRAAFEWLPIGVLIVNADSVIVLANREIERLFGYTSAELIGESVDVLVPDASRSAHAGFATITCDTRSLDHGGRRASCSDDARMARKSRSRSV